MTRELMIYGASGYTGKLLARGAAAAGLRPILAGRDATRLQAVAAPLGLRCRVVPIDDARRQADALRDVHVLLNAAGPFAATARSWVDACLRTGTHYLDLGGEMAVFEAIERRDGDACDKKIMLMPGVGFLVVASDCLARHVASRLPTAHWLRIGTSRSMLLSRGSAKTMIGLIDDKVSVRRNGTLTRVPVGAVEHAFDYGYRDDEGRRLSTAMSMAELITAHRTTGIKNIESYVEVAPLERATMRFASRWAWLLRNPLCQVAMQTQAELLPDGPSRRDMPEQPRTVVVEAYDQKGRTASARLVTPEAYRFTAAAAVAIARRVLDDDFKAGFQTPATRYGSDFVLGLEGVERCDLPS
jgi:short subunit dehydrogenase-like uncharacterized protein